MKISFAGVEKGEMMILIKGIDLPNSGQIELVIRPYGKVLTKTKGVYAEAMQIDFVMCKECKYYNGHEQYCEIDHFTRENGFCSDGKRRENDMEVRDNIISMRELTDEEMQVYKDMLRKKEVQNVFNVNPPKGIETPLKGDVTVFHKNSKNNSNDMELKLERKPQKHRAIIGRGILDTIEYEMAMENTADDILDIIIDIRDTAERIIKLIALQKGE